MKKALVHINLSTFSRMLYRYLFLAIIICLSLGQLTRIQLTSQISFYFHDLLLSFFLLLFIVANCKTFFIAFKNSLTKYAEYKKYIFLFLFIITIVITSWLLNPVFSTTAILYALRFFAYSIFIFAVYYLRLFTNQEFKQILFAFFITFTLFGFLQYFFLPDTRFLENLGWDDHIYRLLGTWFDPAFTGLCLVFAMIYAYYHFPNKASSFKSRALFSISLLLEFIALILTYSRASFLALLIVGAIIFLTNSVFTKKLNPKFFSRLGFLLFGIGLGIASLFYIYRQFPSDSTNLLRTNSIVIRWEMLQTQLSSLSTKDWLIGRGFFVPLAPNNSICTDSSTSSACILPASKQTAAFPDNFFILLLSFFGLPLAILLIYYLSRFLKYCWKNNQPIFYLSLALLVNAQFNQSVFQPFVYLLFGLLCVYFWDRKKPSHR